MIRHPLRDLPVSALAIVSVLACSDGAAAPRTNTNSSSPVVSKPTPTVVRLAIAPDSVVLMLGSELSFTAYTVMSDSSRIPVRPDWWSFSDNGVLAFNSAIGKAVAVGPGGGLVTASLDRLRASAFVAVPTPTGDGTSDALVIESYSLIEYQDPAVPGFWLYVPQMRARAVAGRKVSVLVMRFVIPDLGNLSPFGCGGRLTDTSRDLFGEVYGDWLLQLGGSSQPVRDPGSVTITFIDDAGLTGTRVVTGHILSGGPPTTYSGGQNGGACFHGYGSTG